MQSVIQNLSRSENSGFLRRSFQMRRPKGGGRRICPAADFNLSFFEFFFKISPNFCIEGQPTRILQFFRGFLVWFFQAASHFLPPELKVRLRGAQSSAPMVKLSYHWAEQPIFCISPKAKLPNFRKESDNFSVRSTVCPKAITI